MLKVNDIKERLSEVLSEYSSQFKSYEKFADELKHNSTSIKQYIHLKNTYPRVDFIYKLCIKANINPNWLILGQGEKFLKNIKDKTYHQNAVGGDNSKITQVMHNNDILAHENESLKRENELLREMVELYKQNRG